MTSKFQLEKSIESDGDIPLDSGKPSPPQMLSVLSHGLPSLHRYAYRLLGNKDDAEDAVQDALLSAFKHLNQFRGEAQLSTWLTTIVINCARMHLRKRSRYIHVSLDSRIGEEQEYSLSDTLVDGRPNPEDQYHKSWLNERLIESAAGLSPTLRKTFHLRFVDHLSVLETARVLGVPIGTVKAQTARARAKLLKVMRELLHQGPAGRKSCSRRRPHQKDLAVPAIKPEAASFYSLTPTTSGGTITR
jgi:RNA polymerase sigma factor (sigma-70 family)